MTAPAATRPAVATFAPVEGVICAAVLRVCRTAARLSQDQMAERLFIDINTYRSWEHSRRPLTRLSVCRFKSLMRALYAAGMPTEFVDLLDTAADVDLAIGRAATP